MRRQFDLPESDLLYLGGTGLDWETIIERNQQWLLIHDRPTHDGYRPSTATTAIRIVPGYPDSPLDMVWFHPGLVASNGKQIKALSNTQIDGCQYQRWSRHRTPANAWRPGLDDLAGHLVLVDYWLEREVA